MSWYESIDGDLVWVPKDELVFTMLQPSEDLPDEGLMYMSLSSSKAAFHEHLTEDDGWNLNNGRNKNKYMKKKLEGKNGSQSRGFLVRVEHDPLSRVAPWFREVCKELLATNLFSRIDADEATNMKKQKKKSDLPPEQRLGCNECRVETSSRCHHVANGPGFKVLVCQDVVKQTVHVFTCGKMMPVAEFHNILVAAVQNTGARVFMSRKILPKPDEAGEDNKDDGEMSVDAKPGTLLQKDTHSREEEAWLRGVLDIGDGLAEDEDESDSEEDESWKYLTAATTKSRSAQASPPRLTPTPSRVPERPGNVGIRPAPKGSSPVGPSSTRAVAPDRRPMSVQYPHGRSTSVPARLSREDSVWFRRSGRDVLGESINVRKQDVDASKARSPSSPERDEFEHPDPGETQEPPLEDAVRDLSIERELSETPLQLTNGVAEVRSRRPAEIPEPLLHMRAPAASPWAMGQPLRDRAPLRAPALTPWTIDQPLRNKSISVMDLDEPRDGLSLRRPMDSRTLSPENLRSDRLRLWNRSHLQAAAREQHSDAFRSFPGGMPFSSESAAVAHPKIVDLDAPKDLESWYSPGSWESAQRWNNGGRNWWSSGCWQHGGSWNQESVGGQWQSSSWSTAGSWQTGDWYQEAWNSRY